MMKKFQWILIAALLVCSIPLLIRGISAWNYATSDSIDQAELDTRRILSAYEKTKDAREIRAWLVDGPSEAPGTQVRLVFGQWALQHKSDFVAIVEGLPAKDQSTFAAWFCGLLNEGSLRTEFRREFKGDKTKVVERILDCLS